MKKNKHTHIQHHAMETKVKELSKSGELKNSRYIHFATHGLLAGEKGLSEPCLVLSIYGDKDNDGFLKMSEIFGLQLDADMVVLSACQTGLIKETAEQNIGVSGLARAFFYAGTPRLTVTLWSIGDEGTPELMQDYYKRLGNKKEKDSTLKALNQAKLKMINGKKHSHPFFWAPFILVGEWR